MPKVLATDLDGTLFYPKRRRKLIARKNVKLVRDFVDEGGKLVLVTGRSPHFTEKIKMRLQRPFDVIGMNGAYTIINNKVVDEHFLDFDRVKFITELKERFSLLGLLLISHDYPLLISLPKVRRYLITFYKLYYRIQGRYAEDYLYDNELFDKEIADGQVYKIMLFFGISPKQQKIAAEANKYIREYYGNVVEASWTGGFIEITPHGCSKANGISKYVKGHNYNKDKVFVIGDSGNDISMFHEFHTNSFCLKHAPLKVKKHARYHLRRFHSLRRYILEEKDE